MEKGSGLPYPPAGESVEIIKIVFGKGVKFYASAVIFSN